MLHQTHGLHEKRCLGLLRACCGRIIMSMRWRWQMIRSMVCPQGYVHNRYIMPATSAHTPRVVWPWLICQPLAWISTYLLGVGVCLVMVAVSKAAMPANFIHPLKLRIYERRQGHDCG